jgi:hypothetical protein
MVVMAMGNGRATLNLVRADGLSVLPRCPSVYEYINTISRILQYIIYSTVFAIFNTGLLQEAFEYRF